MDEINIRNQSEAIVIPMFHAGVSGALVALSATSAYAIFVLHAGASIITVFSACFSWVSMASWFIYRAQWKSAYERVLGIAPVPAYDETYYNNGRSSARGYLYGMETAPVHVRVELRDENNGYPQVDWVDFPTGIRPEQVFTAAFYLHYKGASFSMADLCGRGKPLSRAGFEVLRSWYFERNWMVWNNAHAHAQGCELTAAGRQLTRKFAEIYMKRNYGDVPAE